MREQRIAPGSMGHVHGYTRTGAARVCSSWTLGRWTEGSGREVLCARDVVSLSCFLDSDPGTDAQAERERLCDGKRRGIMTTAAVVVVSYTAALNQLLLQQSERERQRRLAYDSTHAPIHSNTRASAYTDPHWHRESQ